MKYFSRIVILFALFFCCQTTTSLFAQTVTLSNIGAVKVDDLTDTQVQDLIKQAQASGLTDGQLKSLAISKGVSEDNVNKLMARIDAVRKNNSSSTNTTTANQTDARQLNYIKPNGDQKTSDNSAPIQIFGAELFNNGNITFEPNLRIPTPQSYILGPDDQVLINIYGNSQADWKLIVTPDGNISLPNIGLLNVSGKTIEQVTGLIVSKLKQNRYAIGNGTTVSVALGSIRSIRVILNGEIVRPGTYTLSSLTTVFGALYASGGPGANGSFRQIELIRDNKKIRTLDIYDFLLRGSQKENIRLQDGDVIRVPSYKVRVSLLGQVKHPAIFEVLPGETLRDVLNFASGFTDLAYTATIKTVQVTEKERRVTDIEAGDFSNYIPLRGDQYTVDKILDRFENRVTINGAVFRPGQFELDKGLTLSQLINKAAGLKEDASLTGSVIRLKPDNTTELISFDVKGVISKTAADVVMQREDVVSIPSIFDLRDNYKVAINGQVRKGGEFPYSDGMTVEDLIIQANGFAEGASAKRIEIARRVNNSDPNKKNATVAQVFNIDVDSMLKYSTTSFKLQPFDQVSVYGLPGYERQRTVKIEGEVLYPGDYTIDAKSEKISSLVKRAGGLTAYADVDGGTLKRINDTGGLDVVKNKIDSTQIKQDRIERLRYLQQAFKDSTNALRQLKNDYVGIDLQKILNNPGSEGDLILEAGDRLIIPKQQQLVKINGEVLFPSSVIFNPLKSRAYVLYANGIVESTHHFLFFKNYPQIKPGSEVVIPKKQETHKLSTAESVGLISGLASMGAVIIGIISLVKK
jgi:protein involved in polysaccharide export with SLBB domain